MLNGRGMQRKDGFSISTIRRALQQNYMIKCMNFNKETMQKAFLLPDNQSFTKYPLKFFRSSLD